MQPKWTWIRHFRTLLSALLAAAFITACSTHSPTIRPPKAAISSAHPLASEAGMKVLREGGNAFDAAIAVASTLGVVEPYSAGIGGGGFWLLYLADEGAYRFVDARERAPLAAHRDLYLDPAGNVDRDKAKNGALAAGIPGQAAAFAHLAKQYGRLPLKRSLMDAIHHARNGFTPEKPYLIRLQNRATAMKRYPASAVFFADDGRMPTASDSIRQPDLADTLEQLATLGRDGFYKGDVAKRLVNGVRAAGGIWTEQDLVEYQVVERQPVIGYYHDAKIISAPLPSSGGLVMINTLNMIEPYDLNNMTSADRKHLIAEAMRRAYHDRARWMGDSDYVDVPTQRLLSKTYAKQRMANFSMTQATPSESLGPNIALHQGPNTTHLSVIDNEGNRVSATLSINLAFGSGMVAPGTGVLLNNEMDDFSSKPGSPNAYGLVGSEANAIEAGKRPLSSMTPTFIEQGDRVAILGTPGGSRIISMVLLGSLSAMRGESPEQWVSLPRYHHQYLPDTLYFEPGALSESEQVSLTAKGHQIRETGRRYGDMQAVLWDQKGGEVDGASDPRAIGSTIIEDIEEIKAN